MAQGPSSGAVRIAVAMTLSWGRRRAEAAAEQARPGAARQDDGTQAIRPFSVTTAETRPAVVSMPRTAQPVSTEAPARRAARAIAGAAFCGSARPSLGV